MRRGPGLRTRCSEESRRRPSSPQREFGLHRGHHIILPSVKDPHRKILRLLRHVRVWIVASHTDVEIGHVADGVSRRSPQPPPRTRRDDRRPAATRRRLPSTARSRRVARGHRETPSRTSRTRRTRPAQPRRETRCRPALRHHDNRVEPVTMQPNLRGHPTCVCLSPSLPRSPDPCMNRIPGSSDARRTCSARTPGASS